jgi:dihydroneopterin aldolase
MQDKIILRGLRFFGRHGISAAERELGQVFQIDMEVTTSALGTAAASDSLKETLDYVGLYALVREVVQGPPRNLVETVAHDIIQSVFRSHASVEQVSCAVYKPAVAIPGKVDAGFVGVQLVRKRFHLEQDST